MTTRPVHPGEVLKDELKEIEVSATKLARLIHVPTNRLTRIMKGERPINADLALRLGLWFGIAPEFWLNLQKAYDLKVVEQRSGERLRKLVEPYTPKEALAKWKEIP